MAFVATAPNAVKKSFVFTSIPAPRSQATSLEFIQYGIHGEIACPIGHVSISPVSRMTSPAGLLFHVAVAAAVQALLLKEMIPLADGLQYRSVLRASALVKELFPHPETVTSFGRDNLKEPIDRAMTGLGFRKDSVGNRTFFRGLATNESKIQYNIHVFLLSPIYFCCLSAF